jgi:hypothetical protein
VGKHPCCQLLWVERALSTQVNIESYHKMQEEYRTAKKHEQVLLLKSKQ